MQLLIGKPAAMLEPKSTRGCLRQVLYVWDSLRKTAKEKGLLLLQAFLLIAGPPPPVPYERVLKRTHYFQVGNRCLCPKILRSIGFFDPARPDFPQYGYRFFQMRTLMRTPQGRPASLIYQIHCQKSSGPPLAGADGNYSYSLVFDHPAGFSKGKFRPEPKPNPCGYLQSVAQPHHHFSRRFAAVFLKFSPRTRGGGNHLNNQFQRHCLSHESAKIL